MHHDIWDYDSPSAPVLFDVDNNGKTVKGIGAPGKTGWLYLLDRETGEPLYGIDEKPVPQSAEQKTAATQPIPRNGEFIPHTPPTAKEIARVKSQITGAAKNVPVVVAQGDVHAAEHQAHAHLHARPAGRRQLGALELQPEDAHVLRLLGRADGGCPVGRPRVRRGKSFSGIGAIAGIGYNESSGTLTAIDATDGSVAWQKTWPDSCYSGTVSTAGNVVFVGRNSR